MRRRVVSPFRSPKPFTVVSITFDGPFPVNAPQPPMTAAQNAFQNTHGATALNSGQNV